MQPTILIVDDNHANRKLLGVTLAAEGYLTVEASDGLQGLQMLTSEAVDLVISDVLMPNMDGYRFCAEMRSRDASRDIPFVFYTSTYTDSSDEQLALDFGADLFLRRPTSIGIISQSISDLLAHREDAPSHPTPTAKLGITKEYSETLIRKLEKRSDQLVSQTEALHRSESRLKEILNAVPDCVHAISRDGLVMECNPAALAMFELESKEQLFNRPISQFVCESDLEAFHTCVKAVWSGEKSSVEFSMKGAAGTERWVEMHAVPLRDAGGEIIALLGITRDNTARKELEAQFVQAQKMEVIGQLAGGVAHDFNNMLGIIMGYSQLMLGDLNPESNLHKDLLTIFRTAERAAVLTRQLLIFSRKDIVQPRVFDLSDVVTAIDPMLRRLIGENITLVTQPGLELGCLEADPSQIEQVLMNLVVNGRDAMPEGGKITISTSYQASFHGEHAVTPHPDGYLVLSVADNGCGMSAQTRSRIFEPFFTTKPVGLGTGLGLATCHSIVDRWGGCIEVESEVGVGTTFNVYFPRVDRHVDQDLTIASTAALPRGSETILIVEDEPGLRELAGLILQAQGYTIFSASNGQEALRIIGEQEELSIQLVISDMIMPEMGGQLLAERLRYTYPEIKMLLTSGYTNCGLDGVLDDWVNFLPKPYTPATLVRRTREAIDFHEDRVISS